MTDETPATDEVDVPIDDVVEDPPEDEEKEKEE
jgi:hypothetical protein